MKLQEDVVTDDILLAGATNVTYNELKTLLSLNLVDNTSDLNKSVSSATQTGPPNAPRDPLSS